MRREGKEKRLVWTQMRRAVRKTLERDVDELHDIMRKNRGRRKKIGKKIRPLTP